MECQGSHFNIPLYLILFYGLWVGSNFILVLESYLGNSPLDVDYVS